MSSPTGSGSAASQWCTPMAKVAPDYPEMECVTPDALALEEANVIAWEWRAAGFYAAIRRAGRKSAKARVYVAEGRERPAPEPKDPTLNAREQAHA